MAIGLGGSIEPHTKAKTVSKTECIIRLGQMPLSYPYNTILSK